MSKRANSNSIRIIAGRWRGRRIPVVDSEGLRPTTDRVRETLYNWLMHDLPQSRCLDLFAGSGVLGLEALSRGASEVWLVESDPLVAQSIQASLAMLADPHQVANYKAEVLQQDVTNLLKHKATSLFDIVFLDPPFAAALLAPAAALLEENDWLSDNALIYVEQDSQQVQALLPSAWHCIKQGKAGQSSFSLYQRQ